MTGRAFVVSVLLGGAGLGLLAGARPVVSASPGTAVFSAAARVSLSGSALVPVSTALLLAVAAGAVALTVAGRRVRVALGVGCVAAGVMAEIYWRLALSDPSAAFGQAMIPRGAPVTGVEVDPVAWLIDVSWGVIIIAGVAVVRCGGRWAPSGRRYERRDSVHLAGAVGRADTAAISGSEESDWDVLTRGDDPTVRPPRNDR
ncbi:Trp biosynthesis-associated membrane protein [Austwickia sp. TVS 96-490-7B]|uniref:Trp biosynthesis-associated membrane protein n=1 Tax=Austwickia sp. TVS 96-490-7B TaxID=2830843 RepID=UPI001C58659D|nr:Trp biosynthesis-associated membrane protein [Austwickia sp. TVS 96-490-7B]